MARTITLEKAIGSIDELLGSVASTKQPVVVADAGGPLAVVVSPEDYRLIAREEARLWETVRRVQERNAGIDPDEVYRDITAVVEEVRQETYDEHQRNKSSHR